MPEVRDIEYKIKLAQLDKVRGTLVSRAEVKKQFIVYNTMLWESIENAIVSVASILANSYGLPFEEVTNLLKSKILSVRESLENDR